ncbi:MAG TPA: hypothetical protein VF733_04945 [Candidatus Saccharimonadales bacterium]
MLSSRPRREGFDLPELTAVEAIKNLAVEAESLIKASLITHNGPGVMDGKPLTAREQAAFDTITQHYEEQAFNGIVSNYEQTATERVYPVPGLAKAVETPLDNPADFLSEGKVDSTDQFLDAIGSK